MDRKVHLGLNIPENLKIGFQISPGYQDTEINGFPVFPTYEKNVNTTRKLIKLNKKINFKVMKVDKEVSKVSIIGVGMITTPGVTYRMFQALSEKKINIMVISTSEIKISVLISKKHLVKAVAALHKEFSLNK